MTLTEPAPQLTPREMDLLRLMCSGLTSYAALTEAMCVSPNTLHYHLTQLFGKLQVNERAQIVAYAMVHGLFQDEQLEWRAGDESAA